MAKRGVSLTAYSVGHFWVDFSCAFLMFSQLFDRSEWGICVLLYNFCAFAMQMPIGLLADRWNRNSVIAALGCVLVALGWRLTPLPMLAAVIVGIGNGCFHIGGGIDVLNISEKRSAALGVFVSPGAFGIYFGTLLGKTGEVPWYLPVIGLLIFGMLFLITNWWQRGNLYSENAPLGLNLSSDALWALVCCFMVVVLRSYVGMVLSFPWKSGGWAFAAVCAVVLGKMAGGFFGDRIGMIRAAGWSLGLAAVLFLFSANPVAGVSAIFLFNMTMPITLWAAARLLPGGKGFGFGMLTFALFLGFLPVYFDWPVLFQNQVGYALGAVSSLALLVLGWKRGRL